MCRLFGFRSSVESRAHNSLVVAENAVANQANQHSDGWGISISLRTMLIFSEHLRQVQDALISKI